MRGSAHFSHNLNVEVSEEEILQERGNMAQWNTFEFS